MRQSGLFLSGLLLLTGIMVSGLFFVDLLAQAVPPASAPAPFVCRWASAPISIDGEGKEAVWAQAQMLQGFSQPWLPEGKKAASASRCRLLWDEEHLYFLAEVTDTELQTSSPQPSGAPWRDDAIELFLKPGKAQPGYFQVDVSARGEVFHAFFPTAKARDQPALGRQDGFAIEAKVRLMGTLDNPSDRDQGYVVEGRIPWIDLLRAGGRPAPGEDWQFNIGLLDLGTQGKAETFSLAAIGARKIDKFMHQTEDFATLRFQGPDMATLTGLAKPGLSTVVLSGTPEPPSPWRLKRLYPGYTPAYPIMARAVPPAPGITPRLMVIHQEAPYGPTVVSVVDDQPGQTEKAIVRQVLKTPRDGTAYDLAFHPGYPDKPYVYIGWNGPVDNGKRKSKASRVTRYTFRPGGSPTLAEATTILEWESDGHNGAALCFAPDGLLLVTSGDGTADSDNDEMGQRTDTLQAKLLRVDVDKPAAGKPYGIPVDNPFVKDSRYAPETYAYGLRNPWRVCADRASGQIWVGNNGQDMYEQAYLISKGANYGWSVVEGSHAFRQNRQPGPTPISKPTIDHHPAQFRSLTGGEVVPPGGCLPDLAGAYVYGDYSTGRIWAMRHDTRAPEWHRELVDTPLQISGFFFNSAGDLVILDHNAKGGLYTLEKRPAGEKTPPFPTDLAATGLFTAVAGHRVAPGLVPYQVAAPFWSDGMHKVRYLAVPLDPVTGQAGKAVMTGKGGWNFPDGTVIVKSFAATLEETRPEQRLWIETRLLIRQQNEWAGYSYRWDEAGRSATLVGGAGEDRTLITRGPGGEEKSQLWHYPSRAECMVCHSRAANFVLGLCTLQANTVADYPAGKRGQLEALQGLGLLVPDGDWTTTARERLRVRGKGLQEAALEAFVTALSPQPGQRAGQGGGLLPKPASSYPALVDPHDNQHNLDLRARSWLHSNCSACHQDAGGGNSRINLEFGTPLAQTGLVGEKPVHASFDLPEARLIAPGVPGRSVLLHRITIRGAGQMPPLASHRADERGVRLIHEWISRMNP